MRLIFVLVALAAVAFVNAQPAATPQKFFGTELPHCYQMIFWKSRLCLTWENDVSALCSGNVDSGTATNTGTSGSSPLSSGSGQNTLGSSSLSSGSGQSSQGGLGTGSQQSSPLGGRALERDYP
uniref:Putative secreted mucin n=1 Tax=Amblyomma triste TaxID=251400 RepID=A0A023G288_AMBTT